MKLAGFDNWIDTFISEKGIDTEQIIVVAGIEPFGDNHIPLQVLIDYIKECPALIQKKVRDTLVKIDFANGDMMHYFKHLALGMAKSQGLA